MARFDLVRAWLVPASTAPYQGPDASDLSPAILVWHQDIVATLRNGAYAVVILLS